MSDHRGPDGGYRLEVGEGVYCPDGAARLHTAIDVPGVIADAGWQADEGFCPINQANRVKSVMECSDQRPEPAAVSLLDTDSAA